MRGLIPSSKYLTASRCRWKRLILMAPEEGMWATWRQLLLQYKDLFKYEGVLKIKRLETLSRKQIHTYLPAVVRNWDINPFQLNIPTSLALSSTQERLLQSIVGKWSPLASFFECLFKCARYLLQFDLLEVAIH